MPCSGFLKLCEPRYDDGVVFSSFLNCVGLQNGCGDAMDAELLIALWLLLYAKTMGRGCRDDE
jgi:hypothetical protein